MSNDNPFMKEARWLTRRAFLASTAVVGGASLAGHRFDLVAAAHAQDGKPMMGGVLRISFPNAPDTLDPQATLSASGQQFSSMVFDNLAMLDDKDQPVPALAVSWKAEKSATEWVYQLREGVKFHHGREFTSEDVVATIERAENKDLGLRSRGAFGPVKEVRAEGKYAVRLIMTQPFSEAPVVAASKWARIIPADRIDSLKTEPVGTGPFTFDDYQPGSSATVRKNPTYWMEGKPYLDGVRIVSISDSVAQQAALRDGQVDILAQISTPTVLGLKGASGVRTYSVASTAYQTLLTQANMEPFTNPDVRRAFKYMVDREALVASALLGQGTVGNDIPYPSDNPYVPASLPQYTQDLNKARSLLDKAGIRDLKLDLYTTSERPPAPKMALAFKEAGEKIGVTLNILDVPFTEYAANVSRKKPLYNVNWSDHVPLYEHLYLVFHSGGAMNYGSAEQAPGLDALLEDMISAVEFDKRAAIVAQCLEKIHDTGERIIPYLRNKLGATSDRVGGYIQPRHEDFVELHGTWLIS
jgi:peptide/nickel transport system substrate-binding protein